jgi:prevent-host-death family protein
VASIGGQTLTVRELPIDDCGAAIRGQRGRLGPLLGGLGAAPAKAPHLRRRLTRTCCTRRSTWMYQSMSNIAVAWCSTSCYDWRMVKIIAQRELRNDNAKVMDAVATGETFVVTRNGEPIAELRPIRAGRRTFVARDQVAHLAEANVRIDHRRFREDLDERIDQGL